MKLKKSILNFTALFGSVFCMLTLAISCDLGDDDNAPPTQHTIAYILSQGTTVTMFGEALEQMDFLDNLNGSDKFTVFAPSDDAFEDFLEENDYEDLDDVPDEVLEKLVLNHLVPKKVLSISDLSDLDIPYMDSSAEYSLFITEDDDEITINSNAAIDDEVRDIIASNGLIHRVDDVITIPTIAAFLEMDGQFSEFYKGLTTATSDEDFMAFFGSLETDDESEAPFTVFSPNNDAFESLLETNDDWEEIEDIEESLLTAILKHHVVLNEAVEKEDLEDDIESLETWEGGSLLFTDSDDEISITDGSGNEGITIVIYDIKTANGIIHGVDTVLIPTTETP